MKIQQDLITINEYSRPGIQLKAVKGIVVHWVANPNTTAKANRDYFENLKNGQNGYGSAHYIIDLNGDVLLCIPPNEMAYHVGADRYLTDRLGDYPNDCTLGIECTHIDWNGQMNHSTTQILIQLCADLCRTYGLNPYEDLYRHYDITGKDCHKWFVDSQEEWKNFKRSVKDKVNQQVSDWAKEAQEWVIKEGISDGTRPKDFVTREEVWTMLYDFEKSKQE